jgi:hypothetical protein
MPELYFGWPGSFDFLPILEVDLEAENKGKSARQPGVYWKM